MKWYDLTSVGGLSPVARGAFTSPREYPGVFMKIFINLEQHLIIRNFYIAVPGLMRYALKPLSRLGRGVWGEGCTLWT